MRDGPQPVRAAARRAGAARRDRRAPAALLRARARPDEVQVTFGRHRGDRRRRCSGCCEPGDEVIVFEPLYDSYAAASRWPARALVAVPLRPPDWALRPGRAGRRGDAAHAAGAAQHAAQPDRHGVHARRARAIAAASCREHDLIAVTDEVYEHLVFDGEHVPLATLAGMAERTLTISSLGKTFSVTGWKIGWATGPAELVAAVRAAKQFLTFAGGDAVPARGRRGAGARRRVLRGAARGARRPSATACAPACAPPGSSRCARPGTYFVNADVGRRRRRVLPRAARAGRRRGDPDVGVLRPTRTSAGRCVRFAFCKRDGGDRRGGSPARAGARGALVCRSWQTFSSAGSAS